MSRRTEITLHLVGIVISCIGVLNALLNARTRGPVVTSFWVAFWCAALFWDVWWFNNRDDDEAGAR